jgi:hypothetical protein
MAFAVQQPANDPGSKEGGSLPGKDKIPLMAARPTINPYRHAANAAWSIVRDVAWDRLRWDMTVQSWVSRRRLRRLQDQQAGRKAVILCNGPSLLKTDFSLLAGVFTFGLNKINLLFDKHEFRPSCIVAVNPYVIEQNHEFYNQTEIPLFIDSWGKKLVKPREGVIFLHSTGQFKFARDCSMSIYQGYTVTYVAMQLAFHMGFSRVALVGCDHSFSTAGPANQAVIAGARDANHFDPNYFAGGVKWNLPDLAQSERAYVLARDTFAGSGRRIVNASEGGKLEVFARMRLEDFIAEH